MPLLKNFKILKASSIAESVIAISIISICALVAFVVYLNVVRLKKPLLFFAAKHKINAIVEQNISKQDYEDDSYSFKGYTIDKKVETNKLENTASITFSIKINDKTYTSKKLIPYHEE
ncbi:hypothetical protein [Seonamhaeicola aphaedonensis]|uniref:Uncharacterized protein n=1 Tax=Seonamhaeicola aphaedonensis TaxID=1461338 RepID=A0A3D9H828_9FLAO|nr:hypothetical protein [Seonamhaeicola aphaedonensis]RED45653.1 hypothetical protein DFQ02_10831 [Seonamhaeicola aphaedonensis]